jgi:hypothetical protein
VDPDPNGQVGRILWIKCQPCQIEPALLVLGVVTTRAVIAQESPIRLGRNNRLGRDDGQRRDCRKHARIELHHLHQSIVLGD